MKAALDAIWPMKMIGFAFTDCVSHRPIYHFRTAFLARVVLAETRWSLFRVESAA